MSLISKFARFIYDSDYRFLVGGGYGFYKDMPDDEYLKRRFKILTGKNLDLKNTETFNEKIQWLKLNDRNPLYTRLVDKYDVKQWVSNKIGKQHIIPTYGVYEKFDDIDFQKLPDSFVMKCTHDSGSVLFCENKSCFDLKRAKKIILKRLKRNLYWPGREWAYKNVKPRIIIEKFMRDEKGEIPNDYKVFNFNGEPKMIQVDYDRFKNHIRNIYTIDWRFIDAEIQYPSSKNVTIHKPKCLNELLELSKILSKEIAHVRIDFYCINEHIYFGEMTFYHGSGFEEFRPSDFGSKVGSFIKLPDIL